MGGWEANVEIGIWLKLEVDKRCYLGRGEAQDDHRDCCITNNSKRD